MHEVILTCVDVSPGGYAAVAEAAELARRFNARLIALSVEEGLPRYASIMGEVDEFKREKDAYFETVGHDAAAPDPSAPTRVPSAPPPPDYQLA